MDINPTTQPPVDGVARLLDATRARLIAVGWKRGGIAAPRKDQPACLYWSLRFCAGLVADETPSDVVCDARRRLIDGLPMKSRHYGLTAWNDAQGRTVEHVVALIDAVRANLVTS